MKKNTCCSHNLKMSKSNLQGFKVLNVKFDATSTAHHEVFMKEHSVRNQGDDKPIGRTLFLINIPPWATEPALKRSFSTVGPVESITFAQISKETESLKTNGFKEAFIVFKNSPDLYKALKLKLLPPLSTPKNPILTGISKWVVEYNEGVRSQSRRETQAVALIKNYDKSETKRKLQEKNGETDDEGWTVVSKKSRTPGISRKESVHNKLTEKMTRKEKQLKNFYIHQIRQEKRDQLATLRKKADEDKKKILALRQKRAFKPF